MNIVFLCGSLEPGHDGVGDYTRRLSAQLLKQGYTVAIIALNDFSIQDTWIGTQFSDGMNVPVVRISSSLQANKRFYIARKQIEEYNPSVISLQFVIFSFHPKGLPFMLAKQLRKLGPQRNWHIMFHELWVGMSTSATWKYILWGNTQKLIIKSILDTLKPIAVDTHTTIYREQLKQMQYNVNILPLFSNIPIEVSSTPIDNEPAHSHEINLISFGTIQTQSQINILASEVKRITIEKGIKINLIIIGRCGLELAKWASVWQAAGLDLHILGEHISKTISTILKNATIGITSTPLPLVEKSGSVAALREHNLPVICIAEPWASRNQITTVPPDGVFPLREGVIEECLAYRKKSLNIIPSVSVVAGLFSTSLSHYTHQADLD